MRTGAGLKEMNYPAEPSNTDGCVGYPEAVRRCVAQLPAIYRSVLVLRDIEELDTSEVGQMLAINLNTVKIRLHRARQALKSLLDREGSLL